MQRNDSVRLLYDNSSLLNCVFNSVSVSVSHIEGIAGMNYQQILSWLLSIIATMPNKLGPTIEAINEVVSAVEKLLMIWGIDLPLSASANEAPTNDELVAENQIQEALAADGVKNEQGRSAIDFSKIRAVLKKAKDLGLLDVVMAALVQKIPLPV